jgi:hypothetical protein
MMMQQQQQHQQDEESDILLKIALCMALALIPPVVRRSNIFPLLSMTYRARAHTHSLSLSKDRRGMTMMRRALCFPLQSSLQVRRRNLLSMYLRCGLDSAE